MDDPRKPTDPAPKARRGFALMDRSLLKAVSSKGGSAPHATKRGFAMMDEQRRREVSQKGLEARRGAPPQPPSVMPPSPSQSPDSA
ncbi:hypothetical protein GN316_18300 [Xylophilus sp. Kf1]|nr:hypothetical protein [Xylophilus sp. Kf1]